jgi:hypothetical protein
MISVCGQIEWELSLMEIFQFNGLFVQLILLLVKMEILTLFTLFSGFVKMVVNCCVVIHVRLRTTHSASIHRLQTFLMATGNAQDVR